MTFDKSGAGKIVQNLTDDELADTIRTVCSSFDPRRFSGVVSLVEVRQLVDVLEHERGRREKATAEHEARPKP